MACSNLIVRLLRDDGAIVYLNGQELFRDNMPPGPVDYHTLASAGAQYEKQVTGHWVNSGALIDGTNYIAVEIHNQGLHSEDIGFDLRLFANAQMPPPRLQLKLLTTQMVLSWP